MSFKMSQENAVIVSELAEILKELAPGEAVPWQQLDFVPKAGRAYFAKQAAKAANVDCDWDRTGVLRCNPDDETTLRRARKAGAGLVNKARVAQRAAERAAANLSERAPTALHKEASHRAGVAGSVRGFLTAKAPAVFGVEKPSLPIFKG